MESIGDLWQGLVFSLTLTRHMATERKRAYAQALAAVRQGMLDSEKEHSLPAFGRGLTACPSLWALWGESYNIIWRPKARTSAWTSFGELGAFR